MSVALLLLVAPNAAAQSQNLVKVSIRDFSFEPSQLVIEPGTTVQWINEGATQHTVFATNPAGAFLSGTLNPGETFTYTFPQRFPRPSPDGNIVQPGTFRYICKIHPEMKGSVIFSEPQREGTAVQKPPPTTEQQPPTTTSQQPPTTEQQPPTVPTTGGISPILPIGLLVAVVAVGLLGWAVKRRSSS